MWCAPSCTPRTNCASLLFQLFLTHYTRELPCCWPPGRAYDLTTLWGFDWGSGAGLCVDIVWGQHLGAAIGGRCLCRLTWIGAVDHTEWKWRWATSEARARELLPREYLAIDTKKIGAV